jgi:hypothetical protein
MAMEPGQRQRHWGRGTGTTATEQCCNGTGTGTGSVATIDSVSIAAQNIDNSGW